MKKVLLFFLVVIGLTIPMLSARKNVEAVAQSSNSGKSNAFALLLLKRHKEASEAFSQALKKNNNTEALASLKKILDINTVILVSFAVGLKLEVEFDGLSDDLSSEEGLEMMQSFSELIPKTTN